MLIGLEIILVLPVEKKLTLNCHSGKLHCQCQQTARQNFATSWTNWIWVREVVQVLVFPLAGLGSSCYGQCICHCVSNCSSLFSRPSKSNTFIFLFIFGLEVIHHRPELPSIIPVRGGGKERDFERQIHLDLIRKHVEGLQMPNTFPLRCEKLWNLLQACWIHWLVSMTLD